MARKARYSLAAHLRFCSATTRLLSQFRGLLVEQVLVERRQPILGPRNRALDPSQ
jgi:hypothetical protein